MRIFVAGAGGAIGRCLVPMLVDAGHQVTGTTRAEDRAGWLRSIGAEPSIVDAYDAGALLSAVVAARPEIVIHQLTDLAAGFGAEQLRANTRLRKVGTRNLVDATLAARAGRLVAQSGGWLYAPGGLPHTETDPLKDPVDAPDDLVLDGIIDLERLVTRTAGFDGIVLRYGFLYGPGTGCAARARGVHGQGLAVVSCERSAPATAGRLHRSVRHTQRPHPRNS